MKCSKCWKREDGCYSGNHREFVDEGITPDAPCPAMKAILKLARRHADKAFDYIPGPTIGPTAMNWARWATKEKP